MAQVRTRHQSFCRTTLTRPQKAQKNQAVRNAATLKRTHLISLGIYTSFILLRWLLVSRRKLPFILLSLPALAIEFWFERIARPVFASDSGELKRAGEDLDSKGLTEWMWDVVYWTWGNVILVAALGDWAWWLYLIVPAYSAYLAFTTFYGVRQSLGGMSAGAGGEGVPASDSKGGQSKRQAKIEKRGGQKVQYR